MLDRYSFPDITFDATEPQQGWRKGVAFLPARKDRSFDAENPDDLRVEAMSDSSANVHACPDRQRRRLRTASACIGATFLWASLAFAAPDSVKLPDSSPFPESVTSTSDGTLYAGSITDGGVVRARPGATSGEVFIKPGSFGTRSTLGVFADEQSGLLWVASNDASGVGLKGPSAVEGAWIKAFDLKTGDGKFSARLPSPQAFANDFALGQDGTLYVTDTAGAAIFQLKPGATALELLVQDERLKGGPDGIDFGNDGSLYVNTFNTGQLFRIALDHGMASKITELKPSRALTHPDAMRSFKGGFLMVEGSGTLDRVTITGDDAKVETVQTFAGPTGVTIAGDRAWVSEGQLAYLFDKSKTTAKPDSFQLRSIPLPAD